MDALRSVTGRLLDHFTLAICTTSLCWRSQVRVKLLLGQPAMKNPK
jgi:hypothetical protein